MAPGRGLSKWRSWLILTDFVGCAKLKTVSKKKILKVWNCHDGKDKRVFVRVLSLREILGVDAECIPGMMCSGVAFHSLPSFEPKKNSKVDCSLWQTQHDIVPSPRIEKLSIQPLVGENTWFETTFLHPDFFSKKKWQLLCSVQKRQFAQEFQTHRSRDLSQKPEWDETLHGDGAWGTTLFEDMRQWYWFDIGRPLYILISWYYAMKLWGYAFLSRFTEFPLELLNSLRISAWILMPLPTKTKCSWIPRHCRLRLQWPGSCFTNLFSHSCSCFSGKCCSFCP